MSRLAEIIQNITYRARLEELKVSQRVSDQVYDKLRLEYEIRQRDAIARVYAKSPERESERKADDATQRHCVSCGKEILPESIFCEFCGSRQPKSR
jgi:RNA polymerase-binding transcription factor DksA